MPSRALETKIPPRALLRHPSQLQSRGHSNVPDAYEQPRSIVGAVGVLVDLQHVTFNEPERALLRDLSVTVSDGDRLGIVGINGTGKSTLLKIVAGGLEPDEGTIHRGRSVRISHLTQRPHVSSGTVRSLIGDRWETLAILDRLGVSAQLDTALDQLSGGQAKRVALAIVLAAPSELLILDEPTNHLDLAGVAWLERWLASYQGAVVIVSHDRHLLDRVTTRMLELDRGNAYLYEGGYGAYLEGKARREEHEEAASATRRNLARSELAWLRRGAKARSRKPQARVDAATRLLEQRDPDAAREGQLRLEVAIPRLGNRVFELRDVSFAYPNAPAVLNHVDLLIGPGDRIGVLGANGSGKSSFLNLLAKRLVPSVGTVFVGKTVAIGYYDQHGVDLDPDARVQDVVAGPHRSPGSLADVNLMKRFWFTGNLPFTRVSDLSGGERRRLQLLAVLASNPNALLLDEPTNDLDLDTLRVLEDFLDDWPGTLVVVSHDRAFLDRTVEAALAVGDAGTLTLYPGGVAAWVDAQRATARRASKPVPTPVPVPEPGTEPRSESARTASAASRQLREIEKLLTKLHRQQDRLNETLLATSDHVQLTRLGRDLAAVRVEITDAETKWLELADAAE